MSVIVVDFPNLVSRAKEAERRSDWVSALNRWNEARIEYPGRPDGHIGTAVALQMLRRFDEAEATISAVRDVFKAAPDVGIEYARIAVRQSAWTEALGRWRQVMARFPTNAVAISGAGTALTHLGRFEEADEFLSAALSTLENSSDVAVTYARVAHRRRDWPEALRRWELVVSRFPDNIDGVAGVCTAFEHLNKFDEWEQRLGPAVARFPNNVAFATDYARAATRRSDWPEALRRWKAAHDRFPNDPAIRHGLGAAELKVRLSVIDNIGASESAVANENTSSGLESSPRDLMLRFESLGGGCMFGLVQRRFGAEPLGLLRWGFIPPASLAKALDRRFEGLGNPDRMRVFERPERKDYYFRDDHYSIDMHTFVDIVDMPIDKMTKIMFRRVEYLKNKLLADLTLPRHEAKIFVYKNRTGPLSQAEINSIFRSLRRHGDHTLLCVQVADGAHPDGTVVLAEEGLVIAYLDEPLDSNDPKQVRYDAWFDVCVKTHEIWLESLAVDPARDLTALSA
jgi:tetratricopeptide (TPR) repeat protein